MLPNEIYRLIATFLDDSLIVSQYTEQGFQPRIQWNSSALSNLEASLYIRRHHALYWVRSQYDYHYRRIYEDCKYYYASVFAKKVRHLA